MSVRIQSGFKKKSIPRHLLIEDEFHRPSVWKRLFGWLFFVTVVLLAALTFINEANALSFEDGDNVGAGELRFKAASGEFIDALHMNTDVDVEVSGMIARVTLKQRFQNESQQWVEGVYVFPLPDHAAVNYMSMQIGDRLIEGKIREKAVAKKIYTEAKKQGKTASLVEQERPNLFTQSVANIGPGETVDITLRYIESARFNDGEFSLRLPMTLTPRYVPGQNSVLAAQREGDFALGGLSQSGIAGNGYARNDFARNNFARNDFAVADFRGGFSKAGFSRAGTNQFAWAEATPAVTDADRVTPYYLPGPNSQYQQGGRPRNTAAIKVSLDSGLQLAAVDSPYHDISVHREQAVHKVDLVDGRVAMDRDFVLQWRPVASDRPDAAIFHETVNGEDFVLLMLTPPQAVEANAQLPRELTFIIDTSGSMAGTSIVQARDSLQLALSRLNPNDKFNIIEFNSSFNKLFIHPVQATTDQVQRASRWVSSLDANGGTEMAPALDAALTQAHSEEFLKQVIFITDGSVANEASLFDLIQKRLGDARLFTVGIGSAPNAHFMTKAAQFGRGTFTFIGKQDEVQPKMTSLFRKLESPQLGDIQLQWDAGVAAEIWPARVPDLYAGEPMLIAAKLSELRGELVVRGRLANSDWERRFKLSGIHENAGVSTLWARQKIAALLDQRFAGRSDDEVRADVLPLALEHQLMSPYTSFVAVEQKVRRPQASPLHATPVPNLMPKGQSMKAPVAYPKTATSAEVNLWLGCFALLLAIFCIALGRQSDEEI